MEKQGKQRCVDLTHLLTNKGFQVTCPGGYVPAKVSLHWLCCWRANYSPYSFPKLPLGNPAIRDVSGILVFKFLSLLHSPIR